MTDVYDESERVRAAARTAAPDRMSEFEAEFADSQLDSQLADAQLGDLAARGARGSADSVGRGVATVAVIVPAMNEAKNLPFVAERMPVVDEIIVVDGNSVDDTVEVARSLWPEALVITQTRGGKGNALACGFAHATADIIVMIDADGSTDPAEIPDFVDALLDGADLAKGSRFSHGGASDDITYLRALGNKGLNWLVNRIFKAQYKDLCYGYNAFWRSNLPILDLPDVHATEPQWGDGFEVETVINVRMIRAGKQIREVGSHERCRIHGRSNLNAFSDGLRVLRTINYERKLHRSSRG